MSTILKKKTKELSEEVTKINCDPVTRIQKELRGPRVDLGKKKEFLWRKLWVC